jgi:pentatricopeptide repeat protein
MDKMIASYEVFGDAYIAQLVKVKNYTDMHPLKVKIIWGLFRNGHMNILNAIFDESIKQQLQTGPEPFNHFLDVFGRAGDLNRMKMAYDHLRKNNYAPWPSNYISMFKTLGVKSNDLDIGAIINLYRYIVVYHVCHT